MAPLADLLQGDAVLLILKVLSGLSVLYALRKLYRRVRPRSPLRNLSGPKSTHWLLGNLQEVYDPRNIQWHHEAIEKYGRVVNVHGMFNEDQLWVADPKALHAIFVRDQHIFTEPDMLLSLNSIALGEGLGSVDGAQHAKQRRIMNPVFSIAHMRTLTPIFYELTAKLCDIIERKVRSGMEEIDMLDWMSRCALEYIAQGGLGTTFHGFEEDYTDQLSEALRDFIPAASKLTLPMWFLPFFKKFGPGWFRRMVINILPVKLFHDFRDMVDVMDTASRNLLEQKRRAILAGDQTVLKEEPGMGKDVLSVLMKANAATEENQRLSDEELIGQVISFIFAAQDTTSSALCRIIYMLCEHPEAQERLREEIVNAKNKYGDQIPYDDLINLPYLDAVCRETLRLHQPVSFLFRVARDDGVLPLLHPITGTDGKIMTEIPVAKYQSLIVGIAAANRDTATWGPDAAEWKPDRWLNPLPKSYTDAHLPGVYSGIMTFGGGSRACIGFKFSQLEMKVVLSSLIEKFAFELPKDKELVWLMWNIQKTAIKGKEFDLPTFPVKVKLL